VTLVNESTPSVIAQTPELVPAVVDPNPPTPAPITNPVTTVKPVNATVDGEDSSEEDDDDNEEEEADGPNEDEEDDNEEEDNEEDEEEGQRRRQLRRNEQGVTYIPGYITDQGELLVPIDTIQRDLEYTIIDDPSYTRQIQEQQQQQQVVVQEGSSAGGIGGGEVETVKEVLKQQIKQTQEPVASGTEEDGDSEEDEDTESEDTKKEVKEVQGSSNVIKKPAVAAAGSVEESGEDAPARPPLAVVPARLPTNEDDELDNKVFLRRLMWNRRNWQGSDEEELSSERVYY
jgi:hypothetical protein